MPKIQRMININTFSALETNRIVEMAWEDQTTFDAIETQFGLKNQEVIMLMGKQMKERSFKMCRKRMPGGSTRYKILRGIQSSRFKCFGQRAISNNKISKR